jgi:hypothetical protein
VSDQQITLAVEAALVAHILVLGFALIRREVRAPLGLNLAVAAAVLMVLATNRHWLRYPVDLQMAGLGVLEILAVGLAVLALARGYRAAIAVSWIVFGLHFLASGAAVVFVLTFKINRLF